MRDAPPSHMQDHLQITFRGMSPSPAIELLVRERAERLERMASRIQRCHVVVDQPHRHQHKGNPFCVRLDITTADDEVVVTREPDGACNHEPMQNAIRSAFDAAARQLETRARRRRAI
ncbi:MAG TPA: HPF/RaiA family ribosome-associated protein [Polyangiaceae bacterium]|nr:HPF/RaiA family ribosome-associated protein [Polyangiaceae bacterium]